MSKDCIKTIVIKFINILYGLALLKILSTYLNTKDFSTYYLLYNLVLYSSTIFFSIQSSIILRYYYLFKNNSLNILVNNLNFVFFVGLFSLFFISLFFFKELEFKLKILTLFFIISFGLFSNVVAFLRIKLKFVKLIFLYFSQLVGVLSFLFLFRSQLDIVLSVLIISSSFFIFALIFNEDISFLPAHFNFKIIRENLQCLKYAMPIVLVALFTFLLSSMDQYFLNYFGFKAELASYIANYNIAEKSVSVLLSIISFVFIPYVFKKYNTLEKKTFHDVVKVLTIFVLLSFIILFLLSLVSSYLTVFLTNEIYVSESWIILYISLGAVFLGINSILCEIFTVKKETMKLVYSYFVGFLANFLLNFLFIPKYGINGAVLTTIISYLFMVLVTSFFVIREYMYVRKYEV